MSFACFSSDIRLVIAIFSVVALISSLRLDFGRVEEEIALVFLTTFTGDVNTFRFPCSIYGANLYWLQTELEVNRRDENSIIDVSSIPSG